jgi:hypothetical protein
VTGAHGPTILDAATGKTETPSDGASFWCLSHTDYPDPGAPRTRDGGVMQRPGGSLAFVCDAKGNPADGVPSVAATLGVGARVGAQVVVATKEGYLGWTVEKTR